MLVTGAIAYGAVCGLVYVVQEQLLFFPRPNDPTAQAALLGSEWSTARDGVDLTGWLVAPSNPKSQPLVLYFGGNGQDISVFAASKRPTANYLYMNYRGYGSSGGDPSAWELKADALHIYDLAVTTVPHNGRVIAHGRSLGSGLATYLAAHRPIVAIILVTPYDSISHVARRQYPWLPVSWLLKHRFDNLALAPSVAAPALFLLAGNDRIIARLHSDALAAAWAGPIAIQHFPTATHNSIGSSPAFDDQVDRFIERF